MMSVIRFIPGWHGWSVFWHFYSTSLATHPFEISLLALHCTEAVKGFERPKDCKRMSSLPQRCQRWSVSGLLFVGVLSEYPWFAQPWSLKCLWILEILNFLSAQGCLTRPGSACDPGMVAFTSYKVMLSGCRCKPCVNVLPLCWPH